MKNLVNFIAALTLITAQAHALTLEQYMSEVQSKNRQLRSYDRAGQASEEKQLAGDIALSPLFFAQAGQTIDEKPPIIPMLGDKTTTTSFGLGFSKKFSSGTSATLNSSIYKSVAENSQLPTNTPLTSSLGITLSQSLWKDFFGHSTELRHGREGSLSAVEKASAEVQRQQLLIAMESAFWDHWYLQEELKVRQSSIERADRLKSWTSKRLSNGIGDKADLLQAEALSASRELQMVSTQDNIQTSRKTILNYLERDDDGKNDLKLEANIKESRKLSDFLVKKDGEMIMSYDAYISMKQAQMKNFISQESNESVKPDLTLEAGYSTNAVGSEWNKTYSDSTKADKPTQSIALKFSMPLDWTTKDNVRNSARYDFESAKLQAEKKIADSQVQWAELQRRYNELVKQEALADKLEVIQMDKLAREQQRLNQGRTTTAQVITFEQDAADAQLTHLKLKSELRKLETQARLFMSVAKDVL